MNEGSGYDNAGAELLEYDEDDIGLRDQVEAGRQDGREDPDGARDKDDEKQTNAQRNVVVSRSRITAQLFATTCAMSGE